MEKVSESGGLKLFIIKKRIRLDIQQLKWGKCGWQAEMDAIEAGERLQNVHMAPVNHLLQLQVPEKAGFQSTIYTSAMVEQRHRRKE